MSRRTGDSLRLALAPLEPDICPASAADSRRYHDRRSQRLLHHDLQSKLRPERRPPGRQHV